MLTAWLSGSPEAHSIRMNVGSVSRLSGGAQLVDQLLRKPIQRNARKKCRSFLDATNTQEVETAADGWAAFPCPHGSLQVWVPVKTGSEAL